MKKMAVCGLNWRMVKRFVVLVLATTIPEDKEYAEALDRFRASHL
jgi:hypothetical protein